MPPPVAYQDFIQNRSQWGSPSGFEPIEIPTFLYDFQRSIVEWAINRGRAAIFADCGLGKSPMQLVWADNVVRKTGRPVLILTPLAVSYQLLTEADKFGIGAVRSQTGEVPPGASIVVTNYERAKMFRSEDFAGVVCDESSILKNFNGVRRREVTELMRPLSYRLLCTATAAPNDYTELGTSSEALGELGHMDMLHRFFKNEQGYTKRRDISGGEKWRLKGHAEENFWQWVCSWARAIRKPSDLGYDDDRFTLPPLTEEMHTVESRTLPPGMLFDAVATNLAEQREERRRTIQERCEFAASIANEEKRQVLSWCHLNDESRLLRDLIPDAEEVCGADSDDRKEAKLMSFARGDIRVLVTKPKIGAWGLNLQRCSHITFFPSHSYEQYYQGVRRCWRFGQTRPVTVNIVATKGEEAVVANLGRKAAMADEMFSRLVAHMNDALTIDSSGLGYTLTERIPSWL